MEIKDAADDAQALTNVRHEAVAWIELIVSGRATTADYEAMVTWRSRSSAHASAYVEAVKLHKLLHDRPARETDYYKLSFLEQPATRRTMIGGATALLVGYGVVRPPLGLWPSLTELSSDYRTGTGEQRTVALADDVSVQLNTRTSVEKREIGGAAGIELVSGEIAVTARKSSVPVYASGAAIFAKNASFNLRKDELQTSLTCLEGGVSIEQKDRKLAVRAGERVRYSEAALDVPERADPIIAGAWRNGLIIFRDTKLQDVVAEINRYRPGKIVIANSSLSEHRLSGEFRIDRIKNTVAQIQKVTGASAFPLVGGILLLT